MPVIRFINPVRDNPRISKYSLAVLEEIMANIQLQQITVTSTAKTASEFAKMTSENFDRFGIANQKTVYGPFANKVIEHYTELKERKKNKTALIAEMGARIGAQGVRRRMLAPGEGQLIDVIDISVEQVSIPARARFEQALANDERIARFVSPPHDAVYYVEILLPAQKIEEADQDSANETKIENTESNNE